MFLEVLDKNQKINMTNNNRSTKNVLKTLKTSLN